MEFRTLGKTGSKFSRLSLGGTAFAGFFGAKANLGVIHRAYELGFNYFDAAPWYTNSESIFAKELAQYPPESYHLTTKIGRYQGREDPFDFSAQNTRESVYRSLDKFNRDSVDIVFMHDIEFAPSKNIILEETLPILSELKDQGLIKNIGIAGYPLEHVFELIEKSPVDIGVLLTYCRATLQDESLLHLEFQKILEEKNIGVINGSINAMGMLTPQGPADWHPGSDRIKKVCKEVSQYATDNGVSLPRLTAHHASTLNCVSSTLLSTPSIEELEKNFEAFYTPLTDHEENVLKEVKKRLASIKNMNWENAEVAKYWRKKYKLMKDSEKGL